MVTTPVATPSTGKMKQVGGHNKMNNKNPRPPKMKGKGKGKGKRPAKKTPPTKQQLSPSTTSSTRPSGSNLEPTKRQKKERVFQLNKRLAAMAKRKERLTEIEEVFSCFQTEDLTPSDHTVSCMVNAYVRVGLVQKAKEFYFSHLKAPAASCSSETKRNEPALTALL
ncbi:unnamed protein product, partial [Amoebophrya sp. A25]|eukprot:GSA25T00001632001.1